METPPPLGQQHFEPERCFARHCPQWVMPAVHSIEAFTAITPKGASPSPTSGPAATTTTTNDLDEEGATTGANEFGEEEDILRNAPPPALRPSGGVDLWL